MTTAEQPDVVEPDVVDDDAQPDEADEPTTPPNREARYRVAAKEARAEADALRATVQAMQSAEVTRLASARLADPTDLAVLGGVEVADVLGEDGTVDADLVEQAVAALLEARPYLEREEPTTFDSGVRGTSVSSKGASWAELLSGRGAR